MKNEQELVKRTVRIRKIDDQFIKKHAKEHGGESAVIRFAVAHLRNCKHVKAYFVPVPNSLRSPQKD